MPESPDIFWDENDKLSDLHFTELNLMMVGEARGVRCVPVGAGEGTGCEKEKPGKGKSRGKGWIQKSVQSYERQEELNGSLRL